MTGAFADEGLVDLFKWLLAQTDPIAARYADLIVGPFTVGPTNTYAALTWLGIPVEIGNTDWTVALNSATHQAVATYSPHFDLDASQAGKVIYGVGYFGTPPNRLLYADGLPVPFQIPSGGSPFDWTFNLLFGGCS